MYIKNYRELTGNFIYTFSKYSLCGDITSKCLRKLASAMVDFG